MKKYWQYWNDLQRLPSRHNLPRDANYYSADRDEAYSVVEGEEEVIYCDGSNRGREWLENLLAWPMITFHGMFYSYGNVAREMIRDGMSSRLRKNKLKIVFHSRGVFGLGLALELIDLGFEVSECIGFGIPHAGCSRLIRECKKRGIKLTFFVVDGDWVTRRPIYGKTYYTTKHHLKNEDKLKGIKNIHLSYGRYLERLDL
jgi:hypothetical protein